MEEEKILGKLERISKDIKNEIDIIKNVENGGYEEIVSLLEKVVKNCEDSSALIKKCSELKYQRGFV